MLTTLIFSGFRLAKSEQQLSITYFWNVWREFLRTEKTVGKQLSAISSQLSVTGSKSGFEV